VAYLDLVKTDFVLAVTLTVAIPLILLLASLKQPALLTRMLAYWRVSALLAITVYLLMAEMRVGLISGVVARVLIPPVLWLGDGLMKSAQTPKAEESFLQQAFYVWRVAVMAYCILGVLFTLPLLQCGISGAVSERCATWFVPPQMYGSLLHPDADWQQLGNYALIGLYVYGAYLLGAVMRIVVMRPGRRG
jgi:hypothetical protein